MRKILAIALVTSAAVLSACGGGSDDPPTVAATDTTVPVTANLVTAVSTTPFTFPAVPDLGTTGTTTLTITTPSTGAGGAAGAGASTGATPTFSIASGGATATGTMQFGSCIFVIANSSFPAGHRLAAGNTVTVNPCNIRLGTQGAPADSVARQRAAVFILGSAASGGSTVTVAINPGGQVTINGQGAGTVTLVPVSG